MAFHAAAPTAGDEFGQIAVALALGGEQHQLRAVGKADFAAEDQRQAAFLGCGMRAHHARERAFVGEGERTVAELMRPGDEFLRVRSAAQKAEIRQAMQLRVGGQNGIHSEAQEKMPCRYQAPAGLRSR